DLETGQGTLRDALPPLHAAGSRLFRAKSPVFRHVNVQFVQHEGDATGPEQPQQEGRPTQKANTPPVALEDLRGRVAAVERPRLFRPGRLKEAVAEVSFTHGSLTFRECRGGLVWRNTTATSRFPSGSR